MIRLWGRANSSNVMKAIFTLEELGLAYERVDVGGPFGGTASAEYRAMQPLGLVPSLEEDGGFTLFESNSICRYLCNAHAPDSPLYPAAPRARAAVEAWMDFQQTAVNRPMGIVFLGLVRTPPDKRNTAAIAAAAEEVGRIWAIHDARLAGRPWLAGETMTLADMVHGPYVHRWFALDIPGGRPEMPHLRAWYERLLARPAYARHLAATPT
jgi:glutathione S-transferase